jgi:hypothetical protein
MANNTENTPLEGPVPGVESDVGSVNYDAVMEHFTPKQDTEATTETGEGDVVYVDEDGKELSPEEVAAAQADGAEVEDAGTTGDDLVEVRIKGRVLSLPREDAEAIEAYRREQRERDGRVGGELQQYRERLAALEAVTRDRAMAAQGTQQQLQKPSAQLALDDFPEYERQRDQYIDHRIATAVNELALAVDGEQKAQKAVAMTEQQNQAWVASFYSENSHLNKPLIRPIVGQVYEAHEKELEDYGDDYVSAFQRLAELTETRITELNAAGRTLRRPPQMEGATRTVQVVKKESLRDSTPFNTANWVARERAKMRGDETE